MFHDNRTPLVRALDELTELRDLFTGAGFVLAALNGRAEDPLDAFPDVIGFAVIAEAPEEHGVDGLTQQRPIAARFNRRPPLLGSSWDVTTYGIHHKPVISLLNKNLNRLGISYRLQAAASEQTHHYERRVE